jgi:ribosomal protein S18 acetylase RimI-like enzyme
MGERGFTVREMEIGDIPEVYELGGKTFKPELWPVLYRNWDEYEVTSRFNTDREYCLVAVSEARERIVGFALGTVIEKPGSAWTYGFLLWLCTHPRWRHEGVAARLVDRLVERMVAEDGIRILLTDTDPENVAAVSFFGHMGFADRREHVYLASNLENNERWAHLLGGPRAAEEAPEVPRRRRKRGKRRARRV